MSEMQQDPWTPYDKWPGPSETVHNWRLGYLRALADMAAEREAVARLVKATKALVCAIGVSPTALQAEQALEAVRQAQSTGGAKE